MRDRNAQLWLQMTFPELLLLFNFSSCELERRLDFCSSTKFVLILKTIDIIYT